MPDMQRVGAPPATKTDGDKENLEPPAEHMAQRDALLIIKEPGAKALGAWAVDAIA